MLSKKSLAVTLAALSAGLVFAAPQSVSAAKVHKAHYKVAKYTGFSSKHYRTGYLTNRQWNYTFYQLNSTLNKPSQKAAFKIKNSLTPLKVKKTGRNSDHETAYAVKYKQKLATEEYWRSYSTLYPYNSSKLDATTITSQTTPFSGKAVLPHGTKTSKLKVWMTIKHGNKSVFYKHVKHGWKYSGTI